jgi:hypothetical protein
VLQLHEVCRENSLFKTEYNDNVSWIFEPDFRKNTRMFIGTEYGFLDAYYTSCSFMKPLKLPIKNNVFISVEPK